MEFHHMQQQQLQPTPISDYAELPPSGSPPNCVRPPTFSPAAAVPLLQYSPLPQQPVVYYQCHDSAAYPPALAAGQASGMPPLQHPHQPHPYLQPADAYHQHQYYYHAAVAAAAGHPHRQSPDALSAKLSPPPPPPPPLCYAYSSPPPSCCCSQLHYHQPCCSPDQQQSFVFQRQPPPPLPFQPLPPSAPLQTLLTSPPSTPPKERKSPHRLVHNVEQRQAASSWVALHQQQLQLRRRNGYMHNILYKTELCRDMQDRGLCPRGRACQFAHSTVELHDPRRHPLYKTAACHDFKFHGHCPRGEFCFHVHEFPIAPQTSPPLPQPHQHLPSPSEPSQTVATPTAAQPQSASRVASGGRGRRRRGQAAAAGHQSKAVSNGVGNGNHRFVRHSADGVGSNDCKPSAAVPESPYRYLLKKLSRASSSAAAVNGVEAKMNHLHLGGDAGSVGCAVTA